MNESPVNPPPGPPLPSGCCCCCNSVDVVGEAMQVLRHPRPDPDLRRVFATPGGNAPETPIAPIDSRENRIDASQRTEESRFSCDERGCGEAREEGDRKP